MRRPVWRRNFLTSLFTTAGRDEYVERYVLREHGKGRALAEILEDSYVLAWSTPEERARILERPDVVAAVGSKAIADLRAADPRIGRTWGRPPIGTSSGTRHLPRANPKEMPMELAELLHRGADEREPGIRLLVADDDGPARSRLVSCASEVGGEIVVLEAED